jgi:hypothetical protein
MTAHKMAGLLAEVLNAQIEDEPSAVSSDVWEQAILGRRQLTAKETKLLWTSPSARASYLRLRRTLLGSARQAWQGRGLGEPAYLMAAASESGMQMIEAKGWKLSITPVPSATWALTLQLERDVAALLPEMAELRLVDGEGLVWGQGRPGRDGALDLDWPHEESPFERLRRTGLRLQVV